MNIGWIECRCEDIELDEYISSYREWNIYLSIPNGGILGAGITNQKKAYCFDNATCKQDFSQDLSFDEQWHIQRCKEKINELCDELIPEGQLTLNLEV